MKARRLIISLLLSAALVVTFIPMIAFGYEDESAEMNPKEVKSISIEQQETYKLAAGIDVWEDNGVEYWSAPMFHVGDKLIITKTDGTKQTYVFKTFFNYFYPGRQWAFMDAKGNMLPGSEPTMKGKLTTKEHKVGTSANVKMKYAGKTTTVKVSFIKNPYKSFTITPTTVTAEESPWGPPDYYLNPDEIKIVVTMTNGEKREYEIDNQSSAWLYNEENDDLLSYFLDDWGYETYSSGALVWWEPGDTGNAVIDIADIRKPIKVNVTDHAEHSLIKRDGIAATCQQAGMKTHWQCSLCGKFFSDINGSNEIEEPIFTGKAHNWKKVEQPAGLLQNKCEYEQCSFCGAIRNKVEEPDTGWSTSYVKAFKVSKGKAGFTAKWKKQNKKNQKKFNGYQIRYSEDKNFETGVKTATASKSSKSKKIKKLTRKTTYYVQVRTYTKANGTTFYSKWSAAKPVTTK